MKLPVYDNQVGAPNPPRFNAVADVVDTSGLAALADGLQGYMQMRQKELDEATKTEYYKADTAIKYELADAQARMIDSIQNGGDYANAEEQYQKTYDEVTAKYMGVFEADPNMYERAKAEYKRDGLEGILRIRNAVQSRRKADARDAGALRLSQLQREYLTDPEAATKKATDVFVGLAGTGAMSQDEGRLELQKFLQSGNRDALILDMQNNPDNPKAVLEKTENLWRKGELDKDDYLRTRGVLLTEIEKQDTVGKVDEYLSSDGDAKKPRAESIDMFYSERIMRPVAEGKMDLKEYESATIEFATKTGVIPTQVAQNAAFLLSSDPSSMTEAEVQSAVSAARIISNVENSAAKMSTKNISPDLVNKAELLNLRVENGMEPSKALASVYSDIGDEESRKIFNKGAADARRIIMGQKVSDQSYEAEIPNSLARAEWADTYASAFASGAKPEEAVKVANKKIKSRYAEFNGVMVRDPATLVSRFDEGDLVVAANKKYTEVAGVAPPEDMKVVLIADRGTREDQAEGKQPSFAMYLQPVTGEPPIAVFDKNGDQVRVLEDAKAMKRKVDKLDATFERWGTR